ncbi:CbrC family protein [Archangium gephyra]|nr:CbrC family protein [Archangium gephyra]
MPERSPPSSRALARQHPRLDSRLRGANSGAAERLRAQLSALSPADREALVQARTTELEACTPHLVTWQDLSWPAHCCDYCRYVAEVGRKELSALAPDGNGAAFLLAHLHERDRKLALEFSSLPPQAPTRETGAYDIGVYLFRCLGCGTAVIHWDAS